MSLQTLVIDDEKAFGEMMALVLQKEGYSVTVVDSAEQGLEHLETHATDLVLCDLHMPGMDGCRFLGRPGARIGVHHDHDECLWDSCCSARGHEVGGVRLYFKTL